MHYTFISKLQGRLCSECLEPLSRVKVRFYRPRTSQNVVAMAAEPAKEGFRILTNQEIKQKANYLITETETDDQGNLRVTLGEKEKYQGGPFEIDICCTTVPHRKPSSKEYLPIQFTLTTLQPRWRDARNGLVASWEHVISLRYWCGIRARFGAWVICGQVTDCQTGDPIIGVKVRAFDVDWLQDDELGQGITNAAGRFRIDYSTEDFKQTPLSPWVNWEMIGGPDLYFRVESTSGTLLLAEPASRGRDADRENAGPCFCVKLCLKEVPSIPSDHTYPLFTKVGQYRVDSDFTAAGLTVSGNYAFTGTIPLRGILPDGGDPVAMEYRFQYAKFIAGVSGPLTPVDTTMIPPTIIGQVEYWRNTASGWQIGSRDYWVNHPDLSLPFNTSVKPGGWVEVPRLNDMGSPGSPGTGKFIPNSWLLHLDTRKLVNETFDLSVAPVHKAGEPVPSGKKAGIHTYTLVFEAREASPPSGITDTNSLPKIVISNTTYTYNRHPNWAPSTPTHAAVCSLDINEMVVAGSGCGTMFDELHALYTAYHPHLNTVTVYMEGNPPLPSSHTPAVAAGEVISPPAAGGSPAGDLFDISGLPPCAYILWMRIELNLTHGWGLITDYRIWDHVAFCKA